MQRFLIFLTVVASSLVIVHWGMFNEAFLIQYEWMTLMHCLQASPTWSTIPIFVTIVGQLLLIISLIQKKLKKPLLYTGLALTSVTVVQLLLAGILSVDYKMVGSSLPFVLLVILLLPTGKKKVNPN